VVVACLCAVIVLGFLYAIWFHCWTIVFDWLHSLRTIFQLFSRRQLLIIESIAFLVRPGLLVPPYLLLVLIHWINSLFIIYCFIFKNSPCCFSPPCVF
jgi:hypothetical protein